MAAPHQDPRVDQIPGGIEPSTVPAAFPAFINADRAVAEVLASIPSPKLRHISINGGGESILKMKRKMVWYARTYAERDWRCFAWYGTVLGDDGVGSLNHHVLRDPVAKCLLGVRDLKIGLPPGV